MRWLLVGLPDECP